MGSFFAGVKAGTLGGILYLGGLALFNVALLYALKPEVITTISQNFSTVCTTTAGSNSTSLEDCFNLLVTVDIPLVAFYGFFVSLLYAGLFGRFYDRLPGKSTTLKGEAIAAIVGINLIIIGLTGIYFHIALVVFFLLWTLVYGYVMGRLYKKYTRLVKFESQVPASIKVLVGRRDLTGKEVTLAHTSTQQVRAEVADDASFKEWVVSGGIAVDDPRSFETAIEINGDGLLRATGTKKY